ncbi:hypothetical protein QAD02_021665 [Eretmocerus hayati]|uniref:Uncharacterized protein n=1 Tax=Eretmocerus hayati TaxID=131215 RepID=A0ACC2PU15_9HYME|nr:hypothetical protein QAD02_021665 [Eretmocerus hayati]
MLRLIVLMRILDSRNALIATSPFHPIMLQETALNRVRTDGASSKPTRTTTEAENFGKLTGGTQSEIVGVKVESEREQSESSQPESSTLTPDSISHFEASICGFRECR